VSVRQLAKIQRPGGEDQIVLVDAKGNKEELPSGSFFVRCWIPDPEFNKSADSAMKHNGDLCEEIIVLTDLINVLSRSRLNAGMFMLPDELSFGPVDEVLEENSADEDGMDPFTREWISQITATLDEPYDLSAWAPLLLRGPKDFLPTKENYITFDRPLDELILRLREDAIVRVVRGLDLPSELVTGKGETNSWSGFGIDQDFIAKHLEPLGSIVTNFLTKRYLRPFLMENGFSWDEAERFEVIYDSSEIGVKQDLTKTAIELFDRNAIGEESLRRLSGVEEADAPTEEEFIRQFVLNLSKLSAPLASILLPLLPEFSDVKNDLIAVTNRDGGPSNQDSPARTEAQPNGPADTKTEPPTKRNSEIKKRSPEKGGLPIP
jgi:hypothetical protein